MTHPHEIDAAALQELLRSADRPLLLDVREPHETALGVIPDARLIPMNDVPNAIEELARETRAIVVYCAHGIRSMHVAVHLAAHSIRATSLRGGIVAWSAAGGEVVSSRKT